MYRCRRATLRDLGALLELERNFPTDRLSRRSFRHLLTRANAEVSVCVEADEILGAIVALYRRCAGGARIYSLVTAPAARGRGVAIALVKAAEAAARRRDRACVYLEVRADNRPALRLYEKLRYRVTRRLARFYEDGTDGLRLERTLARAESERTTTRLAA